MPLTHENIRLFRKLFVNSYNKSSHEESKISPFSNLCPTNLSKVLTYKFIVRITQIHVF